MNKLTAVTGFSIDYENFDIREQPKWVLDELKLEKDNIPDEVVEFINKLKEYNISLFKLALPAGSYYTTKESDISGVELELHPTIAMTKKIDDIDFEELRNQSMFLYHFVVAKPEGMSNPLYMVRFAKWKYGKVVVVKEQLGYIPISPENTAYAMREKKVLDTGEPKNVYDRLRGAVTENCKKNEEKEI